MSSPRPTTAEWTVYGLADPRDGQVRYVGMTRDMHARTIVHRSTAGRADNTRREVYVWWRELASLGLEPEPFEIERCGDEAAACAAEEHHVAALRFIGCDLTNGCAGGRGGAPTAAVRARISEAKKGRPSSVPRELLVARRLGQRDTLEQRIRKSRGKGGWPVEDENGVVYPTAAEAARALGIKGRANVNRSAHHGYRVQGHRFRWVRS